ncbi:MAG: uracil-DNA glycosylase [Proteobacteria bacterium]|nr:uracil-DNA glycosylase [Pseudomonadota bacterium]
MTGDRVLAAHDLLAFYAEAGVDTCVGEMPIDRLARRDDVAPPSVATPAGARRSSAPMSAPQAAAAVATSPPSPETAVMAARAAARSAGTLDELRAILEGFDGCPLKTMASRLVFADGDPRARVMFVGEAPGREEDLAGLPFVGRSGKLLDRIMAAIGLDRGGVYIANIVPWRPPGNRTPTPQESQICLPFVRRQIELVDPDILVCLGGPATQTLLGLADGIMKTRGRWFDFDTGRRAIRATATLHPAYLLRSPIAKRLVWRDFLAIRAALTG